MSVTEDQLFSKEDFVENPLPGGTYDNCKFINCNFEKADVSGVQFCDCTFTGCNLTMINAPMAVFNDARFIDCKMIGIHFEQCSDFIFMVSFDRCNLNHSSFFKRKLKKTRFEGCTLHNTDFTGTDLSAAIFDNCDLLDAKFEQTVLEKADLRTAFNYNLDPDQNKIKKAKFSLAGIQGLLAKFDIVIES